MDLRELLTTRSPSALQKLLRFLLRCLSWPYHYVMIARNLAFRYGLLRTQKSELLVVSIGNLSVGGTGKSPTVAWIAGWFRERGTRVAILSRGYGQLDSGQNDEALELELQLPDVPHLQHWDRVASARLAEEELDMQVLLLDDGFQHRRLARDLDIVLLDASEPRHAQRLLPGGLLREPISALRRADFVMLTRVDQADPQELEALSQRVKRVAPNAKVIQASHRPRDLLSYPSERCPLADLREKRVLAFCAIGNPTSFFATVESLGATMLDQRRWPDHHAFNAEDVESIIDWSNQFPTAELLLCTVKDWVKLQSRTIGKLPLSAVTIELELADSTALSLALERIQKLVNAN